MYYITLTHQFQPSVERTVLPFTKKLCNDRIFQRCKGKRNPVQPGGNHKSKHDKYFRVFQPAAY